MNGPTGDGVDKIRISGISQLDQPPRAPTWMPSMCVPAFQWLFHPGHEHPWRFSAQRVLKSTCCELVLAALVSLNIYKVIEEVDANARGDTVPRWTNIVNTFLLVVFACELLARFFAFRMLMFKDAFNVLDALLVGFDMCSLLLSADDMSGASIFRILRIGKAARTVKLMKAFPELVLMMRGLLGAIRTVLWGSLLAFVLIILWSILAVIFIHPLNKEIAESGAYNGCSRCPHAFESVFKSSVTIFQTIVAGDSWGTLACPIIERHPASMIFFYLVFATLSLATMNAILAVVCDTFNQARVGTAAQIAKQKEKMFQKSQKALLELCRELDTNCDGQLSLDEFKEGFRQVPMFAHQMQTLEIREDDLEMCFAMFDADNSGDVSFVEFVRELNRMQANDSFLNMMINLRFYLTLFRRQLFEQFDRVAQELTGRIDDHEAQAEKHLLSAMSSRIVECEEQAEQRLVKAMSTKFDECEEQAEQRLMKAMSTKFDECEEQAEKRLISVVGSTIDAQHSLAEEHLVYAARSIRESSGMETSIGSPECLRVSANTDVQEIQTLVCAMEHAVKQDLERLASLLHPCNGRTHVEGHRKYFIDGLASIKAHATEMASRIEGFETGPRSPRYVGNNVHVTGSTVGPLTC